MNSATFSTALEALARVRGVRASLVVSATDGILVDSILQIGQETMRVAALAASLYAKARRASEAAGFGWTGFMQMEAERGRLCAIGGDELLLVVIAERDVNVGLIRVEMLRAAEALAS
jgi:predicted regulator of Ras-like GTPase activity (Roadblock/LC7/MglB family)